MPRAKLRLPALILLCGILVLLLSFGIRTSFGIFLQPVSAELGWGREVFAFAMALQNLVWGVAQPFAGAIADRFGSGRVIAICGVLYVLGLYLMSQAETPVALMLGGGVLIGLALSGTGFAVVLSVIGRSVGEQRRSLFLGLGSAGGSSGQLVMVPFSQILLDGYGWISALVCLAAISAVMVPLAAALAGRASDDVRSGEHERLGQAIREASRHSGYWYLTAGFFVCGFHVAFIATHLPAFIIDQGAAPALGASALALIGLGNIVGSLACGVLGGRYRKKYILSGLYLARALVMTLFLVVPVSEASILVFSVAIGLLWLGTVPLTSGLVAQIFGMRYMATLFGFVFLSHQLGSFLGAWYGGFVYDATGSYDAVWWVSVALGVASAVLHWPIKDQPATPLRPQTAES
jgi:MFS family permease